MLKNRGIIIFKPVVSAAAVVTVNRTASLLRRLLLLRPVAARHQLRANHAITLPHARRALAPCVIAAPAQLRWAAAAALAPAHRPRAAGCRRGRHAAAAAQREVPCGPCDGHRRRRRRRTVLLAAAVDDELAHLLLLVGGLLVEQLLPSSGQWRLRSCCWLCTGLLASTVPSEMPVRDERELGHVASCNRRLRVTTERRYLCGGAVTHYRDI